MPPVNVSSKPSKQCMAPSLFSCARAAPLVTPCCSAAAACRGGHGCHAIAGQVRDMQRAGLRQLRMGAVSLGLVRSSIQVAMRSMGSGVALTHSTCGGGQGCLGLSLYQLAPGCRMRYTVA